MADREAGHASLASAMIRRPCAGSSVPKVSGRLKIAALTERPREIRLNLNPQIEAAAKAYRFSLIALLVALATAGVTALHQGQVAGLAALLGGLIVWLPQLLMVGKVFGVNRRGVKPVTMGALLGAEAIKLILVAALFVIALKALPAVNVPHLFVGFVITLAANLVGLSLLSRAIDKMINSSLHQR